MSRPFVATLGTLFVFGSIAAIITGCNALNIANDFLLELGTGGLFHLLPYSMLLMAVAFSVAYVVLRRLHVGRWVRAAGSNLRAAHVSGIDLRWVYVFIFVLSGVLTGLAGIPISGYLASADATQAPNYNLNCIAAVVVGGTSLLGGEGTLVGTALASFLFAMVDNGLILLAVNSYWHYVVTDGILIVALGIGILGKADSTSRDWAEGWFRVWVKRLAEQRSTIGEAKDMKALRLHKARDLRFDDVSPPPEPQADQVVPKILQCGICGTDLHEYVAGPIILPVKPHPENGSQIPIILGHEFSATVSRVGPAVTSVEPGDRVAILQHIMKAGDYYVRRSLGQFNPATGLVGLTWHWGRDGRIRKLCESKISLGCRTALATNRARR